MITNLKALSEALDHAAPKAVAPGEVTAAIRTQKQRIENEIESKGSSSVTVDGRTFRIVRSNHLRT